VVMVEEDPLQEVLVVMVEALLAEDTAVQAAMVEEVLADLVGLVGLVVTAALLLVALAVTAALLLVDLAVMAALLLVDLADLVVMEVEDHQEEDLPQAVREVTEEVHREEDPHREDSGHNPHPPEEEEDHHRDQHRWLILDLVVVASIHSTHKMLRNSVSNQVMS